MWGKVFYDTETVGLHGMPVLLQYAIDDGPITLYSIWTEPIDETLRLIENMMNAEAVIGFNMAFDHFMLCKIYTTLSLYHDWSVEPMDIIDDLADLEMAARDGPCLKPRSALDLMLYARKGPYQSTMDRGDIRIRRVPTPLVYQLAAELEARIPLPDIYFARRKDKHAKKWQVFDITNAEGDVNPDFKDIVLRFKASSALKALATDALKLEEDRVLKFINIEVDKSQYPVELGYAPFAKAIGGDRRNWKGAWPEKIKYHINHWRFHEKAREYARLDVEYLRRLWHHFDRPEPGDVDSTLACMIPACRWRGYAVDIEGLKKLQQETLDRRYMMRDGKRVEVPTSPKTSRIYIEELMDETEKLGCSVDGFNVSTSKIVLEKAVKKWKRDCPACNGEGKEDCPTCKGTGEIKHPAADRAEQVLKARQANYEADLYGKFILAGRFHASFSIIGTLSSRMGGGGTSRGIEAGGKAKGDGLNPQGIKKTKNVRSKFPLAFPGYQLSGGDFSGFEVTLAEAEYNDANLRRQLLTCEQCNGQQEWVSTKISAAEYLGEEGLNRYVVWRRKAELGKQKFLKEKEGKDYTPKTEEQIRGESFENDQYCRTCGSNKGKKIHALFGIHVYPEHTYESLKATDGKDPDLYTRAKSGVFAMMYGGTEHTLVERLGVPVEIALAALARFHKEFPGVGRSQRRVKDMFCSMRQVGGIGTKIEWHEPADFIESMFGFRRYFTLENKIAKVLFNLANNPPAPWKKINIQVTRDTKRGRVQSAYGALQSALYGAAFGMQANNERAANNHIIQSSGATVTKDVQAEIWTLQPHGVHKFHVQPMNIHDEIQCPCLPELVDKVADIVLKKVETFRSRVPLIRMDWVKSCNSWADKS